MSLRGFRIPHLPDETLADMAALIAVTNATPCRRFRLERGEIAMLTRKLNLD
jgi:hypothetical protein